MLLTVGALCGGYGGLELGMSAVVPTELAWVAENDPHASRVLAVRFDAPNLGDITAVDWATVPRVDVVTAGFPCQDLSYAGKGAGLEGERSGLWFEVLRAVRVLRPRWVVVENVGALLARGLDVVTHGLAESGYVGAWTCVRASDVGAAHRRERVFLVAADADGQLHGHECGGLPSPEGGGRGRDNGERPRAGGAAPPDANGSAGRPERKRRRPGPLRPGTEAVEPGRRGGAPHLGARLPTDWGSYAPAIARHVAVLGRDAPDPVDGRGRLSPRLVEWLMMLPEGWVTGVVESRTAALRILGNGVVPLQAAYALSHLFAQLAEREAVSA